MSKDRKTRAWIEVQAAAIRRNLRRISESVGEGVALIPMVKANAYGLGVSGAVSALEPASPWGYGVASVTEGRELRQLNVERPILVFSPIPPGCYRDVVDSKLTACVSDVGAVRALARAAHGAARPAQFHIEVDTGIGRSGFDWRRAGEWGEAISKEARGIEPSGIFTHFHSADEDPASVRTQWQRLNDALTALPWEGGELMVHAANSAAALRDSSVAADAVRPGIYLYGGTAGRDLDPAEAVATVRARVVLVKDASPRSTLGYGATHVARRWERWATLGIGYGDGLPRSLGNRGQAVLAGRRVPIIGRISMDMTVVDITDLPGIEVGDVATLIGSDRGEHISLTEVADAAGTIDYEILTGLTSRLPRIWMDDGRD
jgi:alanine racemase